MQAIGRARAPSRSQHYPSSKPTHSYTSSSEDSYGNIPSHSRSESGTSETHYEDMANTPPPKILMNEYNGSSSILNGDAPSVRNSKMSRDSIYNDPMAMHLLVETAMSDSQHFDILSPDELEKLKSEQKRLARRIEAGKRRLFLETKVYNTSQSINRLSDKSSDPQTGNKRRSLLNFRGNANGLYNSDQHRTEEEDEVVMSAKKCEELAQQIWKLERRRAELHEKLLKHTAGILQMSYQTQLQTGQSQPKDIDVDSDVEIDDSLLDHGSSRSGNREIDNRIQNLNGDMHQFLSQSNLNQTRQLSPPPDSGASPDVKITYLESSLAKMKEMHGESRDREILQEQNSKQTDAVLSGLWEILLSGEEDLRQGKKSMQLESMGLDRGVDIDSSDDEDTGDEPFSLRAFSAKVQKMSSQTSGFSKRHGAIVNHYKQERTNLLGQLQQTHDEHQATQRSVENAQAELMDTKTNMDQMRQEIAFSKAKSDEFDEERNNLEAELVRLQTELTVARAELDGAYGTRAQRAAEQAASPELRKELEDLTKRNIETEAELEATIRRRGECETRIEVLEKELRELVTEYETMVKQNVDSEKERETLEGTVDTLRDHIESLEVKINDEKVASMARSGLAAATGTTTEDENATEVGVKRRGEEKTSMSVMRSEFKKMMREGRAEHFRSLKAEQEERRRLEGVIRSLRKELNHGQSASLNAVSTPAKSGLSRSMTAT